MLRHLLLPALLCLGGSVVASAQNPAVAKRAVADLIAELKNGEREKTQAFQELEALGPKAAEAIPALVELLAENNKNDHLRAIIVLGKIGQPAVQRLTEILTCVDDEIRHYAVWGLALVGPPRQKTRHRQ